MPASAHCAGRLCLWLREATPRGWRPRSVTCPRQSPSSRSRACLSKLWSLLIAHPRVGTSVQTPVRPAGEKATVFEPAQGDSAAQAVERSGKGLLLASDRPGGAGGGGGFEGRKGPWNSTAGSGTAQGIQGNGSATFPGLGHHCRWEVGCPRTKAPWSGHPSPQGECPGPGALGGLTFNT